MNINRGRRIGEASGGRVPFAGGNGVADKEAENAMFAKRVRELMDDGYDMGEAVRQAMKEGYAEGGRVPLGVGDWVKKRLHKYTKEGRDEFKKEWLEKKDLKMTVEEWNALPLKEKIKIRHREGQAQGGIAGMLGE